MFLTLNLVASKSRAVNILGLKIRLLLEQWAIEIIFIVDGDAQARDRYDLVSQNAAEPYIYQLELTINSSVYNLAMKHFSCWLNYLFCLNLVWTV